MDSLDVGIIFVDDKNDILFINRAAEKIRQMKSEERVGTSILDCHCGRMKDKVLDVMNNFKTDHNSKRHRIIKTDGKYFNNTYNVVKDEQSEFLGVVLLSQDITEKKLLEDKLQKYNEELEMKVKERTEEIENAYNQLQIVQQQLIQSEKMAAIGQFVAGLAHQINNPLDGIQNCLNTILSEPDNLEQTKNYAELSIESLYKIEMLVKKLLSYARSHSLEKTEVDVNFILNNILDLTSLKLKNKDIKIENELSPDLPSVYGDQHYLEQVFVNLILNAYDAMDEGGTLTLKSLEDQEGHVVIKVIDTGTGIPKEHIKSIFDPFFTTKQKSNGTGLGLYLSYNFITQHNGKISVKSKEGVGTEFTVLLPILKSCDKKTELKQLIHT
ncbi:MAG TPA: ATP-binding protein [Ignavibacteriaceae bacterium]|nr:ATP-binding protein [Ignavibacteriaceae bacterium]